MSECEVHVMLLYIRVKCEVKVIGVVKIIHNLEFLHKKSFDDIHKHSHSYIHHKLKFSYYTIVFCMLQPESRAKRKAYKWQLDRSYLPYKKIFTSL